MPRLLFPLLAQETEHPRGPVHHSSPQTVGTKVGHRVGADSIDQEHGLSFVLQVTKPTFHCSLLVAHRWSFPCRALIKMLCRLCASLRDYCVHAHTYRFSHISYVCVYHTFAYIYIFHMHKYSHSHRQVYSHIFTFMCTHLHTHLYTNACTDKHIPT